MSFLRALLLDPEVLPPFSLALAQLPVGTARLNAKEQRGLPPRVPDTDRGDNCGFVRERFKRGDEYGNEIDMDATRSVDSIGSDNNGDDDDN